MNAIARQLLNLDFRFLVPRRENVLIIAFVAFLGVFVNRYIASLGGPSIPFLAYMPSLNFYLLAIAAYICGAASYLLIRFRPNEPTKFLLSSPEAVRLWRGIVIGMPPIIALAYFMPSFSLIKSSIPMLNNYDWDQTFIEMDRAIHGTDPWRLLQPVLGFPIITSLLAKAYHAWFMLIYFGSMFFAFLVEDRVLRYRFFFSYFTMWAVGGMAMAVGLASVGPCFLDPVVGNAHFADQMRYLYAANEVFTVDVLEVQEEILVWYDTGAYGLGRGISAMPSMHVALAFLFYLAIRRISKYAGWFFGLFALVIQIASVHLAYHYAVDGYVSIILVALIWWVMGKVTPLILSKVDEENSHAANGL